MSTKIAIVTIGTTFGLFVVANSLVGGVEMSWLKALVIIGAPSILALLMKSPQPPDRPHAG